MLSSNAVSTEGKPGNRCKSRGRMARIRVEDPRPPRPEAAYRVETAAGEEAQVDFGSSWHEHEVWKTRSVVRGGGGGHWAGTGS